MATPKLAESTMRTGTKDNAHPAPPKSSKWYSVVFICLCLLGVGASIELTRIHYLTHTDSNYQSICAVNEQVNCKTVAQSPFSVFLGVPVSVWGIVGHVFMAVLAAWGRWGKRVHPTWPRGLLLALTTASLAASGVLAGISFTRIEVLCPYCLALYAISGLLFATSLTEAIQQRANPFSSLFTDLRAAFARPALLVVFLGVGGGTIATLMVSIEPYWQHPGWADLPKLPHGNDEDGCHWIGAEDPLVTVIEFSDYQCPYCRRAHKYMRLLAAEHPKTVRLIHSHLPLDNACNTAIKKPYHSRACEFSKAAECAAEQDMFWPMNDALFSVQETIPADDVDIGNLAVQIGLDRSDFEACMASAGMPDCIREDMRDARKLRVSGTPTFFIKSTAHPKLKALPRSLPPKVLENAIAQAKKNQKKD